MQRNANVGSKLLALIAVPAVVLVAVASLGALQRVDDADQAKQTETGARLASATTDLAHELQVERLLTLRLVAGDEEVAGALDEARAATDEAAAAFSSPGGAIGNADVGQRHEAAVASVQQVTDLRPSIDEGSTDDLQLVTDTYTTAVDTLFELEGSLASSSGIPELTATLTDSLTLAKAKEARALRDARIAAVAVRGEFLNGDYPVLAELQEEEERQFARLEESQDRSITDALGNTMAEEAVRSHDALLAQVMDEGVIGGSGDPGVEAEAWQTSSIGWLTAVNDTEGSTLDTTIAEADAAAFDAEKSARLYLIGTAAAVILSILLASLLARRINRRLQRLTTAANQLATVELPRLVEDLRNPADAKAPSEGIATLEVDSADEIGQLAEAFNAIQQVTSKVAEEQAALLRRGIADIFVNLARRNQSLLDRQIEFIDGLEAQEQDPDQLENLFKLDHLATRMRRNAESLLVLAGAEPPRRRARPVDLADVVRVAIGEVEDFTRINLLSLDETTIGGNAAVDLAHLLSELMENATQFSPPDSTVEVVGQRQPNGDYTITVSDRGIGMSAEQLAEANALLASPPPVGLALSRSLGFIVVGRLARRLRVGVRLSASPAGGITGIVELPAAVLSGEDPQLHAPSEPATNGTAPGPQLVDEPRPLVVDAAPFGPPSLDAPPTDAPATLSDAIPAGDEFEKALASLVEPGPGAPADDEDVNSSFWGQLADSGTDTFDDLAAPTTPEDYTPIPPPAPAPAPADELPAWPPAPAPVDESPAWEPAPDWLNGELAS
ncbi:MAG TPA: nitrate- and nitrite sensing domain-containing protein, partial [Acidimicrobiales bacterium]|nr:nitrate- and nitrite sensing domain-containing protein [Acidimicrobiales bacterium]